MAARSLTSSIPANKQERNWLFPEALQSQDSQESGISIAEEKHGLRALQGC